MISYYAASIASQYFIDGVIKTIDSNVMGLRKLLDFSLNNDTQGILFSQQARFRKSDSKTFQQKKLILDVSSYGPRASYDESKDSQKPLLCI